MASVIYGKCYLRQMYYGKCNYGKNIYGKNIMANETEPFIYILLITDLIARLNGLKFFVDTHGGNSKFFSFTANAESFSLYYIKLKLILKEA